MSQNSQETDNLQWKCPGCYHINDIEYKNCANSDCQMDIPKDYIKFQKIDQEKNQKENQQEEDEIEDQKQLIKEKLSQLNKGGELEQNQNLGKDLSDKVRDSLNINSEENFFKQQQQQQKEKQKLETTEQQNENLDKQELSENQQNESEEQKVVDNNSDNQTDQDEQQEEKENQVEKSLEEALKKKDEGAQFFKDGQWKQAIEEYEDAIDYCPEEEKKTLSILYSNLGICYIKLELWDLAIENCSKSIQLDVEYRKPYLNRAIAYEKSDREEEALEDLKSVLKMNPADKQLQIQIFRLEKKVKETQEKRKNEVLSGLKDIGNSLLGKFGMSLDNFKLQQTENGGYTVNFNK